MEIKEITAGYMERMTRLALFEPLNELERKKATDEEGAPIDLKGLGLLTLLFFFEQKIMRNQRAGIKELSMFLKAVTEEQVALSAEGFEEVARTIIHTFRPASGKKRESTFFNWDAKKVETVHFSFLKANSFDVKTNSQYYTLDKDGLELIFATKEFYSEFQLSINQLLLRKQLEKGEFKGALRQINEMQIDVESLEERMTKLGHEIKRNIISEDTYNRYASLLEDILYRLQMENEEFLELHTFVKETKERLYYKDHTQKERSTYELVLEISKKLDEVHASHTKLLQKSIDLKNSALQVAQESLYYIGIDSFNMDQDITARIISSPLPLETMKGVLSPFLNVQQSQQWSLLTVLAQQNMKEENEQESHEGFLEVGKAESDKYRKMIERQYVRYMELLLEAFGTKQTITASDFISHLLQNGNGELIENRIFYDFLILLHQKSPIQRADNHEEGESGTFENAATLLGENSLIVKEMKGVIRETDRYSIQEMSLTIGGASFEV